MNIVPTTYHQNQSNPLILGDTQDLFAKDDRICSRGQPRRRRHQEILDAGAEWHALPHTRKYR